MKAHECHTVYPPFLISTLQTTHTRLASQPKPIHSETELHPTQPRVVARTLKLSRLAMASNPSDVQRLQAENQELRQELSALRAQLTTPFSAAGDTSQGDDGDSALRISALESELSALQSEFRQLKILYEGALDEAAAHENELAGERNRTAELEAALAQAQNVQAPPPPGHTNRAEEETRTDMLSWLPCSLSVCVCVFCAGGVPHKSAAPRVVSLDPNLSSLGSAVDMARAAERANAEEAMAAVRKSYDETIANMTAQFQDNIKSAQQSYTQAQAAMMKSMQDMAARMQEQGVAYAALQTLHAQCDTKLATQANSLITLSASVSTLQSQLASVESAKRQMEMQMMDRVQAAQDKARQDAQQIEALQAAMAKIKA